MKKRKTLAIFILLSLLLSFGCLAAGEEPAYEFEGKSLETIVAEFMAANGLTEENFSMGWYDTVSGEEWYVNADLYMPAGSMYKVPLNMELCRRVAEGTLSWEDELGGHSVEAAMFQSVVYSSNQVSQTIRYFLSQNRKEYRNILASFSGIAIEELPEEYYTENAMSPRFVLGTLKTLYGESEIYAPLIELMEQAHAGYYFQSTQGEYPIAHKYGSFEEMLNDCAIVYTPRPFLLVAFTKNVAYNEQVLGELCRMMTEYSLYLSEQEGLEAAWLAEEEEAARAAEEAEQAAQAIPTSAPTPAPTLVPTPEPMAEPRPVEEEALSLWPFALGALCLAAVAAAIAASRRKKR